MSGERTCAPAPSARAGSRRARGSAPWPPSLRGWPLTGWLAAAVVVLVAAIFASRGFQEESLRLAVRSSARTSLLLFLSAFSASSLLRLWPSPATRWLLSNRRYVGVGFACSHLVHLLLLATLAAAYPEPFLSQTPLFVVAGGGIATAFIAAMVLTSSDRAQARLGRNWQRLHRVGASYVWLVFAIDYVPRIFEGPLYGLLAALTLAAPSVRLMARRLRSAAS